MSTEAAPSFSLPNVGPGADPFGLGDVDGEFLLLLFQRDYHCTNCRKQVQSVAERYDEFRERGAEVASIVPEPADRVREWQDRYDLPYPLLSDPDAEVGEAYGQPVRFGIVGELSDFLGRMPEAVLVDCRGEPEIVYAYAGRSTFDRPSVDDLLGAIDEARTPDDEPGDGSRVDDPAADSSP